MRTRLRGIVVLRVAVVCARLSGFHAVISNYCNANGCGTKSERHCDENGCEIGFTFRITNPTDVDAYVQECSARIRNGRIAPKHPIPSGPRDRTLRKGARDWARHRELCPAAFLRRDPSTS